MKSVFARISTAIVAVAAVAASALIVSPALAASNPGAFTKQNWTLNRSNSTATTDTTNTPTALSGATNVRSYVGFAFGTAAAAALHGHVLRIDWHKSFPAGVNWATMNQQGYLNSDGASKYVSAYGWNGYMPNYADFNSRVTIATPAVGDPTDSSLVTVPESASAMTTDQQIRIDTGLEYTAPTSLVAGGYTIAPTLYDKTAGAAVALSASAGSSNVSISTNNYTLSGQGAFVGDVPAGTYFSQGGTVCVDKSSLVEGHHIKGYSVSNGTEAITAGGGFYKKGASNYLGQATDYTVTATDTGSTGSGLRFNANVLINNENGLSAVTNVSTDFLIKDVTASPAVQVESTCAAETPAAPTFSLVSLSRGTFSWPAISTDAPGSNGGRNTRYNFTLFREDAPTVPVASQMLNGTLSGTTYTSTENFYASGSMGGTLNLTSNVYYIAKITATNTNDNTESGLSTASAHSRIVPPATPNTPVVTAVTVNNLTANLAVRAGENSYSYRAVAFAEADTTFASPVGSGPCQPASVGSLAFTCSISSMVLGFNSPTKYRVRVNAVNNNIPSDWSAASNLMVGGVPGVVLGAPSNGTGNGEAKTLTTTFPFLSDSFAGLMSPRGTSSMISNDRGSLFYWGDAGVNSTSDGRKYELKKVNAAGTGMDATFGVAGKATVSLVGTPSYVPQVTFYAGGTKMAVFGYVSNCTISGCDSNVTPKQIFAEGTVGSAITTQVDIYQKARDFCTASADRGSNAITNAGVGLLRGMTALSRPTAQISCNWTGSSGSVTQNIAVTIDPDGTPQMLFKLTKLDGTLNYLNYSSASSNPAATGAQVAAVVLVVRSTRSTSSPTTYTNYERALIRVAANGTVVETTGAFTPGVGAEPTYTLAGLNDGTTVYAVSSATGASFLTSVPVASGNFAPLTPIALDSVNMMGGSSLTFSTFSVPNAGTELAMVRQDLGMNGSTLGPVRVTISTGRAITGEMLSYSSSGSPLNTLYIDAAGNMNLMYTPAVELATPAHYVVQWKNIRAMVAQPNPAFTSKDISFSVNAGGATVTITGVDLALTTAAKKVLSVNVGSKNITAITKTATSIKFVIPTAALAGVVGTPTAQIPSSPQMVSINLGSGATVAAGTITYVGADKLAQTISNTTAVTDALVGDADRTIAAGVTTLVQAATPVLTPTATPATVCTVVANKVHFVGSGVCTVTAASAANSYLAAGTTVTKTITVRKPDTITVTMGDIQTDDSVDGFQVPAAATSARTIVYAIDPSSSTVCRYDATSGAVIGSKTRGSGNNTCKVNLTIAQDATWSAASTQQVLTISNEPETGTAPSAPKNITNSITNAPVTYKYMQYIWNRTTGSISMKINSTWIGPNTVKISWSQGGTNYTCTSAKFGTTAKVAAALVNATKTFTSANFCAAANAATKTALKNIAADTVVKVELTRELHFPATYALRAAAFKPAAIYITLGN